ncbi:hypothetical protein LguiB_004635 [Lonicera macranthoides]
MPHQVYVVSYNAAYPSIGPSYYVPPSPYTYTRAQPDVFPMPTLKLGHIMGILSQEDKYYNDKAAHRGESTRKYK